MIYGNSTLILRNVLFIPRLIIWSSPLVPDISSVSVTLRRVKRSVIAVSPVVWKVITISQTRTIWSSHTHLTNMTRAIILYWMTWMFEITAMCNIHCEHFTTIHLPTSIFWRLVVTICAIIWCHINLLMVAVISNIQPMPLHNSIGIHTRSLTSLRACVSTIFRRQNSHTSHPNWA